MIERVLFSKDECQFLKNLTIDGNSTQSKVILPITNEIVENTCRTSTEFIIEIDDFLSEFLLKKIKVLGIKTLPPEFSILRYEKNQEFKIHTDSGINYPEIYKTLVIQLSEDSDYVGGELCIYTNKDKIVASKEIGNVIIFNSSLKHCANKIEDGVRYCLVVFTKKTNFNVVNTFI